MSMPVITPGTATRDQAVNDIITSVALEQTGLSHILNAEGEKIQAFLAIEGVQPESMLEVNKSVEKMVNSISKLEMILQMKLGIFQDHINDTTTSNQPKDDTKPQPEPEPQAQATKQPDPEPAQQDTATADDKPQQADAQA